MPEWKGPDRRKSKRVKIPFQASYPYQGKSIAHPTENVSMHGFFVSTDSSAIMGSILRFSLTSPRLSGTLEVVGRVVHVRTQHPDPASIGMGVQIRQISSGQDEIFERYCGLIEKELYSAVGTK